ncbi:alpha/beta hydrolase [Bacteriovoracales bacterium]|nr:alpha/beta hydrolase [Bacteriovoracales bacterium]
MKQNRFSYLIILLFLLSNKAEAIPENQINKKWDKFIFKFMESNGKKGQFKGEKGIRINHFKVTGKGNKGAVVFVSGQGEPYIKYYELYYDLLNMGYSPIYTFDHRGQGHSERLIKDPKKGHVDSFSYYIKDFDSFLKNAVLPENNKNLFLLTHSTGGAITLLYMMEEEKRQSIFNGAAFSSPLVKMNTIPIPYGFGKWFAKALCKSKKLCLQYAPGKAKFNAYKKFRWNPLTSNKIRWAQTQRLAKKVGDVWFNGPTVKWAHEVYKTRHLFKSYKGKIKTPLLMLQADGDLLVKPKPQKKLCQKMASNCRLIKMKNSKHEILMEKDKVRNKALNYINKFFKNNS